MVRMAPENKVLMSYLKQEEEESNIRSILSPLLFSPHYSYTNVHCKAVNKKEALFNISYLSWVFTSFGCKFKHNSCIISLRRQKASQRFGNKWRKTHLKTEQLSKTHQQPAELCVNTLQLKLSINNFPFISSRSSIKRLMLSARDMKVNIFG